MTPLHKLHSLAAASALGLAACSPSPAPVSRSPHDPSSPSAPEGAAVPRVANVHDEHAHGHAAPGGEDAVVYVCPMHPEVTSSAPGVCPKCNMKLVPKE